MRSDNVLKFTRATSSVDQSPLLPGPHLTPPRSRPASSCSDTRPTDSHYFGKLRYITLDFENLDRFGNSRSRFAADVFSLSYSFLIGAACYKTAWSVNRNAFSLSCTTLYDPQYYRDIANALQNAVLANSRSIIVPFSRPYRCYIAAMLRASGARE